VVAAAAFCRSIQLLALLPAGPQRPGAHGAAPPAQRPTPPGPTTQAGARRPRPPGGNQAGATAIPLVLLPRQAGGVAPLAPRPGRLHVARPEPPPWRHRQGPPAPVVR